MLEAFDFAVAFAMAPEDIDLSASTFEAALQAALAAAGNDDFRGNAAEAFDVPANDAFGVEVEAVVAVAAFHMDSFHLENRTIPFRQSSALIRPPRGYADT